jgi:RNA polymerase sigma-70 factor (ECF subfamily)
VRPAAARTRRPSDQEVVASVLQGDAAACRELVSRYERSVYDLIYRIVRDPDDTQDLTQETFLKTFKALPDYDPKLSFSPWIATIANNTARDYKRRERRDKKAREAWVFSSGGKRLAEGVPAIDQTASDPVSISAFRWKLALEGALDRLREPYRTIFVMRDLNRAEYKDIAKALRMREGTVRTYAHRARKDVLEVLIPQIALIQMSTNPPPD